MTAEPPPPLPPSPISGSTAASTLIRLAGVFSSTLETVVEKFRFRWRVYPGFVRISVDGRRGTGKIKFRFQIYPAYCGRGLRKTRVYEVEAV